MQCRPRGCSEVSWDLCSLHIGLFWFFLECKQQQNKKDDSCKLQRRKIHVEGSVLCRVGGGNPSDRAVGDRSAAVDVDKLCPRRGAALHTSH